MPGDEISADVGCVCVETISAGTATALPGDEISADVGCVCVETHSAGT